VKDVGMLLLANGESISDDVLSRADKLKTIGYLGDVKGHLSKAICNEKGIVVFDDKKNKKRNAEFIPRRMAGFINNGDTDQSRNFPNLTLPNLNRAHRLLHIHNNVPGVMAQINNIYAENNINIFSQFLMTRGEIGYAVTDIDAAYDKQMLKQLKQVDHTIKFRILYK
jgi:D-3-phosphoglycerate dehydrogenase